MDGLLRIFKNLTFTFTAYTTKTTLLIFNTNQKLHRLKPDRFANTTRNGELSAKISSHTTVEKKTHNIQKLRKFSQQNATLYDHKQRSKRACADDNRTRHRGHNHGGSK